jgi:hypothetical protein
MKWSKQPPEVPGWYMQRHLGGVYLYEVVVTREGVRARKLDLDWHYGKLDRPPVWEVVSGFSQEWAGPILPPSDASVVGSP